MKDEAIRMVENLPLYGDLVPQLHAAAAIDPTLVDKIIASAVTTATSQSGFTDPSSWNDLVAAIHQIGREKTAIEALEIEVSKASTCWECSVGLRAFNQHDKAINAALSSADAVLGGPGLAWEIVIPEFLDHVASLGVTDDQIYPVIDDSYVNFVYGSLGIARAIRHGWPKTARKLADSIAAHSDPNFAAPQEVCSVAAVGQFSKALEFAERVDSDWRLVAFSTLLGSVSARNNPRQKQRAEALICGWPIN